jgi:hypothetical protein
MASSSSSDATLMSAFKSYQWYNSLTLPVNFHCEIRRLELPETHQIPLSKEPMEGLYVTVKLISCQMNMCSAPAKTRFCSEQNKRYIVWDCALSFPIKIRDLSIDSMLSLTVCTSDGQVYGGTTLSLFDQMGALKMGKQKAMLYFDVEGDTNAVPSLNATSGENYDAYAPWDYRFQVEKTLERFTNNQRTGAASSPCPWLDRVTMEKLKWHLEESKQTDEDGDELPDNFASLEELDMRACCFLVMELPTFSHTVLFEEKQYSSVSPHIPAISLQEQLQAYIIDSPDEEGASSLGGNSSPSIREECIEFSLAGTQFDASLLTIVADWDMHKENLSEDMYQRMHNNVRRGYSTADRNAKPNLQERQVGGVFYSAV